MRKIRHAIIRYLAGKDTIAINLTTIGHKA